MRSLSRLTGLDRIQASKRVPALQVAKTAIAAVGAWLLAGWLIPGPLPVFAAVAALLVVQPSVNQSFAKALERSAGVVIGVAVASAISLVLGPQSWVILLAIVVAMIVAWLLRMTATTSNQVAISAMLVLALGASTPEYALDRILETLIGAAFGLLVNAIILPPVLVGPAQRDTAMLGNEIAASLERLADAIEQPQTAASLTEMLRAKRFITMAQHRQFSRAPAALAGPRGLFGCCVNQGEDGLGGTIDVYAKPSEFFLCLFNDHVRILVRDRCNQILKKILRTRRK